MEAMLRQAVARLGGNLAGRLFLLLEAVRLGQQPQKLLKQGGLDRLDACITREAILSLLEVLKKLGEEDLRWLEDALQRARDEGDERTAHRIVKLMAPAMLSHGVPLVLPPPARGRQVKGMFGYPIMATINWLPAVC